jgi:hypothetical protein
VKRALSPSFIRTGQRIQRGLERLPELYAGHASCAPICSSRKKHVLRCALRLRTFGFRGWSAEIARKLALPVEAFSLDRFSIHGCGPVGLHDDAFRYPHYYFVMVVAHSGALGLVDASSVALRHEPGEIILLDPRRKHGLVREGRRADDHTYESSHSPVYDEDSQFLFLDLDLRRSDLQARFATPESRLECSTALTRALGIEFAFQSLANARNRRGSSASIRG